MRDYGKHYWVKTSWRMAFTTYGDIFSVNRNLALAGVLLFGLTVAGMLFGWWRDPSQTSRGNGFPLPDLLLINGFLIFPAVLVVLAKVGGSGYVYRYGWPAVVGLPLGAVFLTADIWTKPAASRVLTALLLVFLFQTTVNFRDLRSPGPPADLYGEQPEARWSEITRLSVENPTIPVAVDGGNAYLQLLYYAPAELRNHMIRVVNPEARLRWTDNDMGDIYHRSLGQFFPWRIEDSASFFAAHKKFLVMSDGTIFTHARWLPQSLLENKYPLTLLWEEGPSSILLAEESSPPSF
jgi:hypothetical protein